MKPLFPASDLEPEGKNSPTTGNSFESWLVIKDALKKSLIAEEYSKYIEPLSGKQLTLDTIAVFTPDEEFLSNYLNTITQYISNQRDSLGLGFITLTFESITATSNRDENQTPFQSGTHILASGEVVNIPGKDIKMEPIALSESGKGIFYPTTWRIKLSGRLERSFMVKANNPHQISNSHLKNFPNYWEGSSDVLASDGKTLLGHAFLEMTGYDPDAIPKF